MHFSHLHFLSSHKPRQLQAFPENDLADHLSDLMKHLAAVLDGLGKEGVCVGVVDVLRSRQGADKVVSIAAIVGGATDGAQVSCRRLC